MASDASEMAIEQWSCHTIDYSINAGQLSASVISQLYGRQDWDRAVSADGLFSTFSNFFGHPFDYAIEPWFLKILNNQKCNCIWTDVDWAFTGGLMGWGWISMGSLDFAPGKEGRGCIQSDMWSWQLQMVWSHVQIREGDQDLDAMVTKDRMECSVYAHRGRDRVEPCVFEGWRTYRHPSCEGAIPRAPIFILHAV